MNQKNIFLATLCLLSGCSESDTPPTPSVSFSKAQETAAHLRFEPMMRELLVDKMALESEMKALGEKYPDFAAQITGRADDAKALTVIEAAPFSIDGAGKYDGAASITSFEVRTVDDADVTCANYDIYLADIQKNLYEEFYREKTKPGSSTFFNEPVTLDGRKFTMGIVIGVSQTANSENAYAHQLALGGKVGSYKVCSTASGTVVNIDVPKETKPQRPAVAVAKTPEEVIEL